MKFLINCVILSIIICNTFGFKLNLCEKNIQFIKNNQLKKNTISIDRKLYAKYLIDKRKSEKILKTNILIKFLKDTLNDIDTNNEKMINNINNISEYTNQNANIKNIIIGNNIYIDVKNVKNIIISTKNETINIELDKNEKKVKNIINEIELLSKNIKELDTLINLLDIFLTILK